MITFFKICKLHNSKTCKLAPKFKLGNFQWLVNLCNWHDTIDNIHTTLIFVYKKACSLMLEMQSRLLMYPLITRHLCLNFWWRSVDSNNHCVITLIWLQCNLFLWFHFLCLHFLNLAREYYFSFCRRIDTICLKIVIFSMFNLLITRIIELKYWKKLVNNGSYLNRDNKVTTDFQKVWCVDRDNSCLIWLSYISKYCINHRNQHSIV